MVHSRAKTTRIHGLRNHDWLRPLHCNASADVISQQSGPMYDTDRGKAHLRVEDPA